MPGTLGYSFSPTAANAEDGKRGGNPPATSQSALQTLNFRLPTFTGATQSTRAISPLVSQNPVGSNFGDAVIQSVLKTVLGPGGLDGFMGVGAPQDDVTGDRALPPGTRSPIAQPGRDPGSQVFNDPGFNRAPSPNPSIHPGDFAPSPETPDFSKVNPSASSEPAVLPSNSSGSFSGSMGRERDLNSQSTSPSFGNSVFQDKYGNGDGWGQSSGSA